MRTDYFKDFYHNVKTYTNFDSNKAYDDFLHRKALAGGAEADVGEAASKENECLENEVGGAVMAGPIVGGPAAASLAVIGAGRTSSVGPLKRNQSQENIGINDDKLLPILLKHDDGGLGKILISKSPEKLTKLPIPPPAV